MASRLEALPYLHRTGVSSESNVLAEASISRKTAIFGTRVLLPLAVFTADNDRQIFTVTLDLSVQPCKNASLSLAIVAWYVLHGSAESINGAVS